ncbi:hypothetical protein GCM10009030_06870 [Haloarcula pellucida]|uniref:Uncharacterized protein n=1 Tax=Haloarcula pellucida TaxID=1427151 RepID=A0A830GGL3_9EURY|nr:hypothetical protein GCM10009030_06870 [Halomicroarcula pellucida]
MSYYEARGGVLNPSFSVAVAGSLAEQKWRNVRKCVPGLNDVTLVKERLMERRARGGRDTAAE